MLGSLNFFNMKYLVRFLIVILFIPFWTLWASLIIISIMLTLPQGVIYFILKGEMIDDSDMLVSIYMNNSLEYLCKLMEWLEDKEWI